MSNNQDNLNRPILNVHGDEAVFLRDRFAERAMQYFLTCNDMYTDVAEEAYHMADAMLEARVKRQ